MKPQIVAGILAAVVVVGGGIYYYSKGGTSVPAEAGQTATTTDSNQQGTNFKGTLNDLMARGGEWKCSVASNTNGISTEGIVYVSGNKVRSDLTATSVGTNYEVHMISDGSYIYSWSSAPQGVKTKVAAASSSGGSASGQGSSFTTKYTYDCSPEQPQASLFVPPTSITFMSY